MRILADWDAKSATVRIVDRTVTCVKVDHDKAGKRRSRSLKTSANSAVRDDNVKKRQKKDARVGRGDTRKPKATTGLRKRRFTAATAFRYSAWPMLDLGYVREHLDAIEKMARDRGVTLDLAPFREIDTERRQLITSAERLKAERNRASEQIAGMKRTGEDAASILALMKEVSERLKRDDVRIAELDERLKQFLLTVPNIPHASVPVGKSAADNVEIGRAHV